MQFSQTTPETLAGMAIANIGREVDFEPIPTDGALKAVQIICKLLDGREKGRNAHQSRPTSD